MAVITITVYDEGRKHYEKFECEKTMFLSSMRYFRDHVKNTHAANDCNISVYCDVSVFSWLISYVKTAHSKQLDDQNIIAILVSSSFLQMDELVSECTKYISRRCSQLMSSGTELVSLSDDLLRRLSQDIREGDMEALWASVCQEDAGNAEKVNFVNKLFRLKMEHLLRVSNTAVLHCARCKGLFSAAHISQLKCPSGERQLSLHEPDREWKLRAHLQKLLDEGHIIEPVEQTTCTEIALTIRCALVLKDHVHVNSRSMEACIVSFPSDRDSMSVDIYTFVLPQLREPRPETAITSLSHIKDCLRSIEQLKCLEVAHVVACSSMEQLGEADCQEMHNKLCQQGPAFHDAETSSEDALPHSGDDCSEDSALQGENNATSYAAAGTSCHVLPDSGLSQGGLLSAIGSNLLQLQDFGKLAEETAVDRSLRNQLCQEEDRRRMGVLQSFLETFREEPCPSVSHISAGCPKRVHRSAAKSRSRQNRSHTSRPQHARTREVHS